jgi:uncharacterized protein YxjI
MGASNSIDRVVLKNINTNSPLDLSFIYNKKMTFVLKQDFWSWSGRDYIVRDSSGNPIIKFDAKMFTLRGKIYLYDVRDGKNEHIFTLRRKIMTKYNIMRLERPEKEYTSDNRESAEATLCHKLFSIIDPIYYVFRKNVKLYKIKGSFFNMKFVFHDHGGNTVAIAGRDNLQFPHFHEYGLECAPGADTLLCIVAMVYMDLVAAQPAVFIPS